MKLKTRIMLMFLGLTACIVLTSTIVMTLFVTSTFRSHTMASASALNRQTRIALNNMLSVMDEASLAPVLEPELYEILRREYPTEMTTAQRYAFYADLDAITERLYSNVYYRGRSIWGITLYLYNTETACYKNKGSRSPDLTNIEQQMWFRTVNASPDKPVVFALENDEMYPQQHAVLCLGRVIQDAGDQRSLAAVRVDVPQDELQTVWENAMFCDGAQLLVQDRFGNEIYSSLENAASLSMQTDTAQAAGEKYYVVSDTDAEYGYRMSLLVPVSYVQNAALGSILLICLCALVCMGLATVAADLLIDRIMRLIRNLNQCMKDVRAGDLSVRCAVTVGGEFGEVCESFNSMVDTTQHLIGRIYKEEEEKRHLELQALQAQISPHFLLNTLNAIKWMAFLQGNKSIEAALGDLAHILGFAIRDTRDRIPIRTELEQLEHYLHILSIRYPNLFTVDIQADPEVLDCMTLKFILQPFLENSIFHGFDGLGREGHIEVRIRREGEMVHYTVRDNGHGIPSEQLQRILSSDAGRRGMNRIGISNVANRIRRTYGECYGVQIESKLEEYTCISITIPAQPYTEKEEQLETDRDCGR